MLDEGLEKAKLIFGGRRLSPYLRPHFVSENDFARICRICEPVWSAIQKVKDAAVADPKIVDDLGLSDIEKDLVAIDPGYAAVSPTSRLDSFLTTSAYSFVELNGESPAGIAYADAAYDIFSSLPVMKEFAVDYNVRPMYGRHLMLDVLISSYQEYLGRKPERPPRIAIVDLACVAGFYVLRVIAGGEVNGTYISPWIVLCVFFGALFMVIGKRRAEFLRHAKRVSRKRPSATTGMNKMM